MESNDLTPASERRVDSAILARTQELASYGMLTTDTDLRITKWNAWLEIHSGIRAEEAVGRPLFSLFGELISRRVGQQFHRALQGEVAVLSAAFHEYLFPFRSPVPGRDRPHMLQTARIAPLLVDGRICGTIAVIEDVTQREHQAAALQRQHLRDRLVASALEQLLAAPEPETLLPDLFARVAEQLHADVYLNYLWHPAGTSALRLSSSSGLTPDQRTSLAVGPAPEEVAAAPLILWAVPDSPAPEASVPKELGLRSYFRHSFRVADRFYGTLAFGSRERDAFDREELEFAATVCRHVAVALDRAQAERELRKAHADLEEKVTERTVRLKETITQLESFSYTVAHDLRAPIRVMRGYADVLLEELGDTLSPAQRQYLAKIRIGATRMELLTRDLLEFSRVSREQVHLSDVDPEELLRDIILLTPGLQVPEVLTVQTPLPRVRAQRMLLKQCLTNLLENAMKFVTPGTQPRLVVRGELSEAGDSTTSPQARPAFQPASPEGALPPRPSECDRARRVRIWVEDNGIGIAPENQRKVFGVFERLHSREGYEGTGVGLAIVARSVQRMGGRCGVESQIGEGSRFWIELPAA